MSEAWAGPAKTARTVATPRRPRGRAYAHPDLMAALASTSTTLAIEDPSTPTYTRTLNDLLAKRAPRGSRR